MAAVWAFLIPFLVKLILRIGLPLVEKRFPGLQPLIDEALKVMGGAPPSPHLESAATHYNACVGAACSPPAK